MNDKIEEFLKQPWTIPTIIGVLSFGGGVGLGYFLSKRKFDIFEVDVHDMPSQLKFDFNENKKDKPQVRPPKVVITEEVAVRKDILKVNNLSELRSSMLSQEEPDEEEVEKEEPYIPIPVSEDSDFIDSFAEWDYEEELPKRTSTAPYILHQEEFYADELNYTQTSLTYYALDNIMADEDDKPVYNHANVTGELRFGHGSGQENVVYIRNDERRAEYEITMLEALYSVEILGLEIENNERVADLKHSKIPKFRMD